MSETAVLRNRKTREKQTWDGREKWGDDILFRFEPTEFEALMTHPRRDL